MPGVIISSVDQLLEISTDVHLVVDSVHTARQVYELLRIPFRSVTNTRGLCYNHHQPLLQNGYKTVFDKPTQWLASTEKVPETVDPIVSLSVEEIRDSESGYPLRSYGDVGLPRYELQEDSHTVIEDGRIADTFETRPALEDAYPFVKPAVVPFRPRYDNAVTIRMIDGQTLTDYEHSDFEVSTIHIGSEPLTTARGSVQPNEWSWIHLIPASERLTK